MSRCPSGETCRRRLVRCLGAEVRALAYSGPNRFRTHSWAGPARNCRRGRYVLIDSQCLEDRLHLADPKTRSRCYGNCFHFEKNPSSRILRVFTLCSVWLSYVGRGAGSQQCPEPRAWCGRVSLFLLLEVPVRPAVRVGDLRDELLRGCNTRRFKSRGGCDVGYPASVAVPPSESSSDSFGLSN